MNRALIFLLTRSLRGRMVRWLRLMRQPKYLVGFLVGLLWFSVWFGSAMIGDSTHIGSVRGIALLQGRPAAEMLSIQYAGALALAVLLSIWWLVPFGKTVLELKENELHLLLPSPIPRRHILQYAVVKHQPGILFGAFIMAVFLARGGPGHRLWIFVTFWVILTLWNLHSRGRGLWLARLRELPLARSFRFRLLLAGGLGVYWILLGSGLVALGRLLAEQAPANWPQTVSTTIGSWEAGAPLALAGWLLQPFVWLLQPILVTPQTGVAARLIALAPPLVLVVAHNRWVVRSQVRFEESALARARQLAAGASSGRRYRRTSKRSRRWHPFRLAPTGSPALGVLWKNLIQVQRLPFRLFFFAALGIASLPVVLTSVTSLPVWFLAILLFAGWILLVAAPFLSIGHWRNDLRSDLLKLELVRTWPIGSWRLLIAEVLGPATLGFGYAFCGALFVLGVTLAVELNGAGGGEIVIISPETAALIGTGPIPGVAFLLAGVLPLLGSLTLLSTTLQNLVALTFPGWVHLGPRQRPTAARMGQNILMAAVLFFSLAVGLAPGALLVGGLLLLQLFVLEVPFHAAELAVAGVLVAVPVVIECGVLLSFGAKMWRDLDPSRELLEGDV